MTVIAWDGQTLAADKQATAAGHAWTTTKLIRHNGSLAAGAGTLTSLWMMHQWFRGGEQAGDWPATQKHDEDWCTYMVIRPDKSIWLYEQHPIAFRVEDDTFACGVGRDYAYGAMAAGANAIEAVEIASRFSEMCGLGVDFLRLDPQVS